MTQATTDQRAKHDNRPVNRHPLSPEDLRADEARSKDVQRLFEAHLSQQGDRVRKARMHLCIESERRSDPGFSIKGLQVAMARIKGKGKSAERILKTIRFKIGRLNAQASKRRGRVTQEMRLEKADLLIKQDHFRQREEALWRAHLDLEAEVEARLAVTKAKVAPAKTTTRTAATA